MTSLDLPTNGLPTHSRGDSSQPRRGILVRRARRARWLGRLTLVLPVAGAAAGAWLLSRGARGRAAGWGTLGVAFGLGVARWQLQRFVTETVPYEVVARLGEIEIRSYPRQIWAETVVEQAAWSDALNEGFRRLAGYIFGNELPMTAPVLADANAAQVSADRRIAFVMPGDRDEDALPVPSDERVRLRVVHERLVAALAFRGDYESDLPAQKRDELLQKLRDGGLATRGPARFAGYDPPSTLPMLRRNEVMIDLQDVLPTLTPRVRARRVSA